MLQSGDVEQYLLLGHETRPFEIKGPGDLKDKAFCAKVARAAMAMANLRDGGLVCLGIDDVRMAAMLPGLTDEQVRAWSDFDNVSDALARYSDPPVSFEMNPLQLASGVSVVVLEVAEFDVAPHVCRKTFPDVLQDGMTYVRPRGKPESVPVPSHVDMRDLLDLATSKGVREFVRRADAAGIHMMRAEPRPDDGVIFDKEAEGTWAVATPVVDHLLESGYTEVEIRPGPYQEDRVSPAELATVMAENAVRLRGWPVPMVDQREPFARYGTWIGQDIRPQSVSHCEAWRLTTSGQFVHRRELVTDQVFSAELAATAPGATGSVAVWDVLLYMVEVAELATRLAIALNCNTIRITASLNGIAGRELVAGDHKRELHGPYLVQANRLATQYDGDSTELLADSRTIGVQLAQGLLRQFGLQVPDNILLDWQEQILT